MPAHQSSHTKEPLLPTTNSHTTRSLCDGSDISMLATEAVTFRRSGLCSRPRPSPAKRHRGFLHPCDEILREVAVIELHRATDKLRAYHIHPGCGRHATIFAIATSRGKELAGHAKHTPPYCPERPSGMRSPESLHWSTSFLRVPLHRYPPLVNTGRHLLGRGADKD